MIKLLKYLYHEKEDKYVYLNPKYVVAVEERVQHLGPGDEQVFTEITMTQGHMHDVDMPVKSVIRLLVT